MYTNRSSYHISPLHHLPELKIGNLNDQITKYDHDMACQQQHVKDLNDTLQSCRNDLSLSADTIASLTRDKNALQNSLEKKEKDLSSRIAQLEHDLSSQRVNEETLRLDRQKTIQELDNTTKKNEALQKQVADLQDNLRDTVEASKQKEKSSLESAQKKSNNEMAVMEAKLQNVTQQLAKAEEREQKSSISAQEARQETSNLHQMHNNNIANLRRELSQQHKVEVDKISLELESAKQEITHQSAQLQDANNSMTKQSAKATKNLNDAENRIKDINHELESKSEQCERLEMELNEVRHRIVVGTHISYATLFHSPVSFLSHMNTQSNKLHQQASSDVESLTSKVGALNKEKDDLVDKLQIALSTLEDERRQYKSTIKELETDILASVREKFSSINC